MTKRTKHTKTQQYTAKVHRQHNSLVVTLPKELCRYLEIVKGDIILFEVEPGDVAAVVGKMALRGVEDLESSRNTIAKDKSR